MISTNFSYIFLQPTYVGISFGFIAALIFLSVFSAVIPQISLQVNFFYIVLLFLPAFHKYLLDIVYLNIRSIGKRFFFQKYISHICDMSNTQYAGGYHLRTCAFLTERQRIKLSTTMKDCILYTAEMVRLIRAIFDLAHSRIIY